MTELSDNLSDDLTYCPICQVPFKNLKIKFSLHINMCDINWNNLEECKDGVDCKNDSIFHFRDYSHQVLANHRENIAVKRKRGEIKTRRVKQKENHKQLRKKQNRTYYMPEEEDEDDIFMDTKCNVKGDHKQRNKTPEKDLKKRNSIEVQSEPNESKIIETESLSINVSCNFEKDPTEQLIEEPSVYDLSTDIDESDSNLSTESNSNSTNNSQKDSSADLTFEHIISQNIDKACEKKEKCKAKWEDIFNKRSKKQESFSSPKLEITSKQNSTNKFEKKPKVCPSYKKMPGTTFAVDAFQYGSLPGITAYFLSHFHSDHYIGLKKSFSHLLYCSLITANLVKKKIRVDERYIRILELNQPMIISNVEVTCFDANHCPGSILILFRLLNGEQYLHVGDFRASVDMEKEPELQTAQITRLYLDTTYFDPQYVFPSQTEVISRVRNIAREKAAKHPKALFISGSYLIGKEKVFLGILDELKCKLWAQPPKRDVFRCINDEKILSALTDKASEASLHVLPMNYFRFDRLKQHLLDSGSFSHVFAFKPTGWEMGRTKINDWINISSYENITIYGVPYSEHSNYEELCRFIRFIKADKVIPTVPMRSREMWSHLKQIVDTYKEGKQGTRPKQQSMDQYMTAQ